MLQFKQLVYLCAHALAQVPESVRSQNQHEGGVQ